MRGTENSSSAQRVLLRDAIRKLLQIDAAGQFEEIKEPMIDVFFEGEFYICYDPKTGHLGFVPTPKLEAEMQDSNTFTTFEHKTLKQ